MLFSCLSDACLDWWCNNRRGRRKCKVPVSLLLRCWWWCFKRTKCNLPRKILLNHFTFKKYAQSLSLICSKRHTCYFWNYILFKISSLLKTIIYHPFTTFFFWKFVSLLVFIVNIAWIYTILSDKYSYCNTCFKDFIVVCVNLAVGWKQWCMD